LKSCPISDNIQYDKIHYYHENPMAWGTYMLRKPFMLVFIRLRVKARALSGKTTMKMIHEKHEKHEKKIKIIRVNSCNSWASLFIVSGGCRSIMKNYHIYIP